MRQPLGARQRRRGEAFGAAIQFPDHSRAQPVDPFFLQPGRAGRRQVPHRLQRRHVVFAAHLFGQPPDAPHHRRHEIEPGRLVALDLAQRRLGVEFRHQHHRRADLQRAERGDERAVVIHRPRHQHDVVLGDAPERRRQPVDQPGLSGDDQLGPPGRAARGRRLPRRRHGIGQIAVVLRCVEQAPSTTPPVWRSRTARR